MTLRDSRDIADLIGAAFGGPSEITRDKSDFAPEFWTLGSGLLGELAQKLANYRLRLILTGDFGPEIAASAALRDYFRESARGGPIRLARPHDLT